MQRKKLTVYPVTPTAEERDILRSVLSTLNPDDNALLDHNRHYKSNAADEVQFTHDILCRHRRSEYADADDLRYEVIDSKQLGEGAFGSVHKILATIEIDASNELHFKQQKKRIVKEQGVQLLTLERDSEEKLMKASRTEADLSLLANRLHSKQLSTMRGTYSVDTKTFLVMKEFNGVDLWAYLGRNKKLDYTASNAEPVKPTAPSVTISAYDRYQITVDLLRAYNRQIKKSKLIHRDLKPENILIAKNNRGTFDITFIDFGLAKKANDDDAKLRYSAGNPLYKSPEAILRQNTTIASELYGLGMIIAQIWGAANQFDFVGLEDLVIKKKNPNYTLDLAGIFSSMSDLNETDKTAIKNLIASLTKHHPHERIPLEKAITLADELRVLHMKRSLTNISEINKLVHARTMAMNCRNRVEDLVGINPDNIIRFKNEIFSAVEKIPDESPWYSEFVNTAELQIPINHHSKDKIKKYVQNECDSLLTKLGELDVVMQKVRNIESNYDAFCKKSETPELKKVMRQLANRCREIENKRNKPLSIEEMQHLTESCQHGIDRITTVINKMREQKHIVNKVLFSFEANKVINLRNALRTALLSYIDSSGNQLNQTRIANIETILTIINNSKDDKILIDQIRAETSNLKLGFFGRSKLRDQLLTAIDIYSPFAKNHSISVEYI